MLAQKYSERARSWRETRPSTILGAAPRTKPGLPTLLARASSIRQTFSPKWRSRAGLPVIERTVISPLSKLTSAHSSHKSSPGVRPTFSIRETTSLKSLASEMPAAITTRCCISSSDGGSTGRVGAPIRRRGNECDFTCYVHSGKHNDLPMIIETVSGRVASDGERRILDGKAEAGIDGT